MLTLKCCSAFQLCQRNASTPNRPLSKNEAFAIILLFFSLSIHFETINAKGF
jgi:hypothetical protein